MLDIRELPIENYEKVVEIKDDASGLHGFIAVHSTALGPSLGGTRILPYPSDAEALEDVLRLSKAMSYKSALVETGLGGGKSVIIADPKKDKTEALLFSFAEALNRLGGIYIAAEDVGTNTADMAVLSKKTPYVAALATKKSSGDPSPFTAYGIYRGMQAVAKSLWGSTDLNGKTIAIQGLGKVGHKLAEFLFWDGANLILSDIDQDKLASFCIEWGAKAASPEEIFTVPCDIFAPCALGGIINSATIPKLRCKAIAGSTNNQLLDHEDAYRLYDKGILYAPDYVINAGGIINVACEYEPGGYDPKAARQKTSHIFDTLLSIFEKSKKEHKPTSVIADNIAEHNLANHIGQRKHPIQFN